MSEDHVANLNKVRARMVENRRALAVSLAQPYQRGTTEQTQEQFMDVQAVIDVVDRALQDEKAAATKVNIHAKVAEL